MVLYWNFQVKPENATCNLSEKISPYLLCVHERKYRFGNIAREQDFLDHSYFQFTRFLKNLGCSRPFFGGGGVGTHGHVPLINVLQNWSGFPRRAGIKDMIQIEVLKADMNFLAKINFFE